MSLVLGIETATGRLSVALGGGPSPAASISVDGDRRHVEVLVPTIEQLLALAGHRLADVRLIAVDVGPGLFTGMRAGIATAQGLALALGTGVVPVRSVDVLAHPFRHAARPVVAVVDARRGEVFRSIRRGGALVADVACTTPDALAEEVALLGPCLLVGDGAVRHADRIAAGRPTEVVSAGPSAEDVVALALHGTAIDPADVVPLYLRDADATPNFEVAR